MLARRADRRVLGFTLVELIVTIVILGILAALAVPALNAVTDRSREQTAARSLEAFAREATAVAAFRGDGTFAAADFGAAAADWSAGVEVFDTRTDVDVVVVDDPDTDRVAAAGEVVVEIVGATANLAYPVVGGGDEVVYAVANVDGSIDTVIATDATPTAPEAADAVADAGGSTPGGGSATTTWVTSDGTAEYVYSTTDPAAAWTASAQYPMASSLYLKDIETDGTTWAAGTRQGRIFTSSDALTWSESYTMGGNEVHDIEFADGLWVAVSDGGYVATSSDAATWNATDAKTATDVWKLNAVSYDSGAGRWVAAGQDSAGPAVITSTDGVTWSKAAAPPLLNSPAAYAGAAANGTIVVGGYFGDTAISTDGGASWTSGTAGSDHVTEIKHHDGLWVLANQGGGVHTSTDASWWPRVADYDYPVYAIAASSQGEWIAVGNNGLVVTSPDGATWGAPHPAPAGAPRLTAVASATR